MHLLEITNSLGHSLSKTLKKILREDTELSGCVSFLGQKGPINNKQEFFQTKHLFNFHVLWPLSLCDIKKILQADLEQRGHHVIFGPKMNHCPEQ